MSSYNDTTLPPVKRSYRLNELVDGRYYRCRLSCKVVLWIGDGIKYYNDATGYYNANFDIHDFQLQDL